MAGAELSMVQRRRAREERSSSMGQCEAFGCIVSAEIPDKKYEGKTAERGTRPRMC